MMHVLILLDESTGKRLVWRFENVEQEMEVANALMGLSVLPVREDAPAASAAA